jgi:hypothetical protein
MVKHLARAARRSVRSWLKPAFSRTLVQNDGPGRPIDVSIVDDIFTFIDEVPPFYDGLSVPSALRIGVGWRTHLEQSRPTQLRCLATKDRRGYRILLDQVFQSELVSGLWSHAYWGQSRYVPFSVLREIDSVQFTTGRGFQRLPGDPSWVSWGVRCGDRIVRHTDADHLRQAVALGHLIAQTWRPRHGANDRGIGSRVGFRRNGGLAVQTCRATAHDRACRCAAESRDCVCVPCASVDPRTRSFVRSSSP